MAAVPVDNAVEVLDGWTDVPVTNVDTAPDTDVLYQIVLEPLTT